MGMTPIGFKPIASRQFRHTDMVAILRLELREFGF